MRSISSTQNTIQHALCLNIFIIFLAGSLMLKQPFGTVLGYAPGDVPAYSSDYDTASEIEYPARKSFRSYVDGIYMGYKWQCVEFARRWMYINHGYIFDDVGMAYDIFDLRYVRDIKNNTLLPLQAFTNGSRRHPVSGSLLIWQEGGEFEHTGHVAIVTEVSAQWIRVAEQNVHHEQWAEGQHYSRQLPAKISQEGEYWVTCSFGDAQILGWMIQTDDDTDAEPAHSKNEVLFTIKSKHADKSEADKKAWLNIANRDEEAFVNAMGGHCLTKDAAEQLRYFIISRTACEHLEKATNDLHGMFMHATDYVLEHPELMHYFNLPDCIIPKLRQSWDNRLTEVITSRFDFALVPEGLKVYEYNCDSASCYMEAGKVQGKWSKHYGIHEGVDAGKDLFADLVKAWQKSRARDVVHILHDDHPEETYHGYFMQDAIEAAGLRCKMISHCNQLVWDKDGDIVDGDGEKLRWVWKTWAWETALDQIREEQSAYSSDSLYEPTANVGKHPRLSDVLLHKSIMVFEPLWSLIPSNKAILPVLWSLFPNHPLLLHASFELNDELRQSGYVSKPIVGRCGANITLYDAANQAIDASMGEFEQQPTIYQALLPLPKIDRFYTQLCTFTAKGIYSGCSVRVDESMIIKSESDCLALRILDDKLFLNS
jgi:glutathionylspermidine amidase/synthetase